MNLLDLLYYLVPLFTFAALIEIIHFLPYVKIIATKEVYESIFPISTPFLLSFLIFDASFIVEIFFHDKALHKLFEAGAMTLVLITTVVVVRRNLSDLQVSRATRAVAEKEHKKYKGLIEKMNDGFWSIDNKGITNMVNHKMGEMLGYRRNELLGQKITDFVDESEQIKLKRQEEMRPKGVSSTYEINLTKKDGSNIPVIVSAAPIFDDDGRFRGSFAIVTDVSRIKEMEEELKDYSKNLETRVEKRTEELLKARDSLVNILEDLTNSKKELAEAYDELKDVDRLKTDILSNISHELRTPITIAKSSIELTRGEADRKEIDLFLDMCENALNRLNDLIENLVDISSIYKGTFVASGKTADLDRVLKTVLGHFKTQLDDKQISMSYPKQISHPLIKADEKMVSRVLTNLMDNAVKFNKKGGKITIKTKKADNHVEMSIWDTGIGIDPKYMDKIFEPFYQIDPTTTREFGGTGIGLALVKAHMEALKGRVRLESAPGKGSTFYLEFPISQEKGL